MSNGNSARSVTIALFTGLAIGVIIGILFAPKSGKETRNNLMDKGQRLMEMGKEVGRIR